MVISGVINMKVINTVKFALKFKFSATQIFHGRLVDDGYEWLAYYVVDINLTLVESK